MDHNFVGSKSVIISAKKLYYTLRVFMLIEIDISHFIIFLIQMTEIDHHIRYQM